MVMNNIVSSERVRQRQKGSERMGSQGRTEGGMYVEVDGWMVQRESRAE